MADSIGFMLLLQVVLIGLNAVFACAEIAIISVNDTKLNHMAADGNSRAQRLVNLTKSPARFLSTIQVAITLSGFLGSAFAAENFSDKLVHWLVGLGVPIPADTLNTISVILITLILSYFTLVFGELVPKQLAMRKAEQLALGLSGPITGLAKVFAPIVWLLTKSTNGILRLLRIDPNATDDEMGEEEIRMMVDAGSEKGVIDQHEKEFIDNVFEFDDLTAGEIATHRTEITLLWMEESMDEWMDIILSTNHTRYPVCEDTADDVIGILNIKDLLRMEDKSREAVMREAVKQPYFVPESVKADVLFRNMKRTRNKMAVVLDEYGGMSGIVTLNDLIEQLVGELGDEDEEEEIAPIQKIDEETWRINGSAPLEDVSKALGVALPCEEYDTFNGLVFDALGAVPSDGATVELQTEELMIRVTDIQEHQIENAIVRLIEPAPEEEEDGDGEKKDRDSHKDRHERHERHEKKDDD